MTEYVIEIYNGHTGELLYTVMFKEKDLIPDLIRMLISVDRGYGAINIEIKP